MPLWWHKGSRCLNIIWHSSIFPVRGGGGVLPYKGLMGMCRWMGSYFHNCIDYNGVAFSRVTRMGSHIFRFFGVRQLFIFRVNKWELQQRRQLQLQKCYSKLKVCSCCCKVYCTYHILLISSNAVQSFGSWILKDSIYQSSGKEKEGHLVFKIFHTVVVQQTAN